MIGRVCEVSVAIKQVKYFIHLCMALKGNARILISAKHQISQYLKKKKKKSKLTKFFFKFKYQARTYRV